jgi:Eph receptor B1
VRGEANNNASVKSVVTSDTAMPFTGLMQRTEYGFQVRAKTTHGWGEFSPPVFKTTGQVLGTGNFSKPKLATYLKFIFVVDFSAYVGQEDNVQMRILAGAIVGTVVVVVLVIVLVVLFFKRYGIKTSESPQLLLLPHAINADCASGFVCFSRGTDDCNKKQPSDCDTLEYRNGEGRHLIKCALLHMRALPFL